MECHTTDDLVYCDECDQYVCRECMKPSYLRRETQADLPDVDFDSFFGWLPGRKGERTPTN